MKPPNSSGPILATAENRDTVAIEPLSKYWNGSRCGRVGALELGLDRLRRVLAALDRALRHARHPFDRRHVADDEHVRGGPGWTGPAAP
mgnify:CR=1 FL=1